MTKIVTAEKSLVSLVESASEDKQLPPLDSSALEEERKEQENKLKDIKRVPGHEFQQHSPEIRSTNTCF